MAREDVLRGIPLVAISTEQLDQDLRISRELVEVQGSIRTTARMVDCDALDILERRLVDDGDLPPSWAYWWLTLVAEISYNAPWSACTALILYSGQSSSRSLLGTWLGGGKSPYQVMPLRVDDMCEGLRGRTSSAGFALAWGVNGRDFDHPTLPIACRGAILPVVDGMGALCMATDEDRSALHLWMGDEEIE